MYDISLSDKAKEQLAKLPIEIKNRIGAVIERIRLNPYRSTKRKEGTPYFIMRAGDYRAILDIDNQKKIIYVLEAGHRKNIYG